MAKGTVDVRGQWAFSNVDDVVYDPTGGDFGPVSLDNKRNGGYLQAAYRASESESKILADLEGVLRYDKLDVPDGAPEGYDQARTTIGINYYTSSSSLFKLAYRFDNMSNPGESADAVLFQWAIGL